MGCRRADAQCAAVAVLPASAASGIRRADNGRPEAGEEAVALRPGGARRTVYLVAIRGGRTGWAKNALHAPEVRLRLTDGTHVGSARQLRPEERQRARAAYCERVYRFDYAAWLNWRPGRPDAQRIKGLLRDWFDDGMVIAVDVRPARKPGSSPCSGGRRQPCLRAAAHRTGVEADGR